MKALTSSASEVILDKYRNRIVLSSKEFHYRNRPDVLFLPSKKLVYATRFLQQKALQPISALSSDAQAEQEAVAQTPTPYESKTVHIKFQLQKDCQFGEQFFLVGDDPMLGLWEPTSAIAMEWSDGHIWIVELDIPVGKSIQFKFILKESTGDIVWQPGQDRILQTWETKNTITVCEHWENAEYQKIIEEDPTVNSKMLVADNFTQPKEESVSHVNNMLVAVDTDVNSAKIPEKPIAMVAENINYPKKDPVSNASNKVIGEEKISQPEDESVDNENMMKEEVVLANNGRAATIKNLTAEDLVTNASNKMVGEKPVSQLQEELVANKKMMSEEDALRKNGRAATFKNLTAENISDPKAGPELNASNTILGEKQLSQPAEEPVAKKNMMIEEDVLRNNERAAMTKNSASTNFKGNLITHEEDAVLVPGLTPLPTSAEGEIQDKNQKNVAVEASGNNEAPNYYVPKLEKQEPQIDQDEGEKVEIFKAEEQHQLGDEQKHQMTRSGKQEQQPDAKPFESNVLEHDIQWGRRTLQTILSNLGLL